MMMIHEYNPCIAVQIVWECGCKKAPPCNAVMTRLKTMPNKSKAEAGSGPLIDIGKVNIGYPVTGTVFPERSGGLGGRLHPSLQNESEVLVCQVATLGIWILFDSDTASQSVSQ